MLEIVEGDFLIEVAGDPRVTQSLLSRVPQRGLGVTQLLDQTFGQSTELTAELEFLELYCSLLVPIFVFSSLPQRMAATD